MTSNVVDGPYSWAVAVAGSLMYFVMYGLSRVSGLLFVSTLDFFDTNREIASFPFTLSFAVRFLGSPFAGYFAGRFGIRFVILMGCGLSFVGVGACYLSDNIFLIVVFWGVLFGIGSCFCCTQLQQLNNIYFEKHLAASNGLSYAGASLSSLFIPPLVEMMLNEYGIKGTYLLLSGFALNAIPIGLILKEPSNGLDWKKIESSKSKVSNGMGYRCNRKLSSINLPLGQNAGSFKMIVEGEFKADQKDDLVHCKDESSNTTTMTKVEEPHKNPSTIFIENGNAESHIDSFNNKREIYVISYSEENTVQRHTIDQKKKGLKYLDIFLDIRFLLISFVNGILILVCLVLPTILNDFSLDKGISITHSTYLLMAMSVADVAARLGFGWVTDGGYMSPCHFCAVCFLILTACLGAMVIANNLLILFAILSIAGLSMGAIVPLSITFIKNYIKPSRQLMANSCIDILGSPFLLSTSSLLGFFRDGFGSYDWFVYLICLLTILCCVIMLVLPCIKIKCT